MKSLFNMKAVAEIAIFAAIGYVLDFCAGAYSSPLFPNGGSIGIAMLAVLIVAFRRGGVAGILTGFIMGLLDLADGFYAIAGDWWKAFIQVALDYWLAYPLVGTAGFFSPLIQKEGASTQKRITIVLLASLLGGLLKFGSHYFSGVLFWGDDASSFAWGLSALNKWSYSFIYNIAYMAPCTLLSCGIIGLIAWKYPRFIIVPSSINEMVSKQGGNNNEKGAC